MGRLIGIFDMSFTNNDSKVEICRLI